MVLNGWDRSNHLSNRKPTINPFFQQLKRRRGGAQNATSSLNKRRSKLIDRSVAHKSSDRSVAHIKIDYYLLDQQQQSTDNLNCRNVERLNNKQPVHYHAINIASWTTNPCFMQLESQEWITVWNDVKLALVWNGVKLATVRNDINPPTRPSAKRWTVHCTLSNATAKQLESQEGIAVWNDAELPSVGHRPNYSHSLESAAIYHCKCIGYKPNQIPSTVRNRLWTTN